MEYSFSFCGTDVRSLGLKYAAETNETYKFIQGQFEIEDEKYSGHDGGYYFGTTTVPKPFSLRCYYEKEHVDNGLMTQIHSLFRRGRSGRLVFSSRPWLYYICTVTSVDTSKLLNLENGFVTIGLTAYYPFAQTDYDSVNDNYESNMIHNSALLPASIALPSRSFTTISSQRTILLYNGGTERASVTIDIGGNVGGGVNIYNRTTGQMCEFVGLSSGSSSKYVEYDGYTGNTYWVSNDANNGKNAFIYHGSGSIQLEPAYPIKRDVQISTTSGSTTITTSYSSFNTDMIGKYIYACGDFRRIVNVGSEHNLTVNTSMPQTTTDNNSVIVTMNEIVISPNTTMSLNYLRFKYNHTFA